MVRQEIESLNQVVSVFGQDIDDWRTDGTRNSGNVLSNKKKKTLCIHSIEIIY